MRYKLIFISLFLSISAHSQIINSMEEDESKLYAATKQVNQFFRRFNGEESVKGKRFYKGDRQFRSENLRKKYLKILFDEEDQGLNEDLKKEFIKQVSDKNDPRFIDFHAGDWYANVSTEFYYKNELKPASLILKLEQENLGYKWVLDKVYFHPYDEMFILDTAYQKKFLHPMSHELEFMNLKRVFSIPDSVQQYTAKEFRPDYLSLFLYEVNSGKLKYKQVTGLKFHFFQVSEWYFELSYFNRKGYNTGWLISDLVQFKPEEKEMLMEYILYH